MLPMIRRTLRYWRVWVVQDRFGQSSARGAEANSNGAHKHMNFSKSQLKVNYAIRCSAPMDSLTARHVQHSVRALPHLPAARCKPCQFKSFASAFFPTWFLVPRRAPPALEPSSRLVPPRKGTTGAMGKEPHPKRLLSLAQRPASLLSSTA